eukprot:PLAT11082.1.p1 GENE.PLAT11082.1~~PLAT11082.1.p1  ORF type:complete len:428 (+),score=237.79 PLAT11082.1:31-1314(+)
MAERSADEFKAEGNEAFKAGRYEEAVELYTSAIERDGENATYYCNRAGAYSGLGKWEAASKDAKKAVTLRPRYAKAHVRLGTALYNRKRFSQALASFQQALKLNPDSQAAKDGAKAAGEADRRVRGLDDRAGDRARAAAADASASATAAGPAAFKAWALGTSAAKLRTTQAALRAGMLLMTLLYFVPLIGSSAAAFKRVLLLALVNYVLYLYSTYGMPKFTIAWFAPLMQDTTFHYLFLCAMFYSSRPLAILLLAVLLTEMVHLAWYASVAMRLLQLPVRTRLAAAADGVMPRLIDGWATKSTEQKWRSLTTHVPQWSAYCEVAVGFVLILELLTPMRRLLMVVLFWQFLRLRYVLSPHTKLAFAAVDSSITAALSHSVVPAVLRNGYTSFKGVLAKMTEMPKPSEAGAAGAGAAGAGGLMSKCTVM